MSKCLNARLVFIRLACVMVAFSYVIFSCAAGACAQWTGSYGNVPLTQGPQQGYPAQSSAALPDDWPRALSVPGMENVAGLAQGDNELSYAVRIISQDGDKVNFQVEAFCVANPTSEYAMLHILDRPLPGVVDPEKKTLQIDFSPLAASPASVEIIDKADVDKVLMQEADVLVLHTVMSVQSMDRSQVKFSLSDMSLLQPDGVLNEFSLPGPVPAVFDPMTYRFSTVAFDEMTSVLQQNYVVIQQNTVINVVNVVNQVNVVNVVDFGGFGCGGWAPYGGCGYGGWPGMGYGDYGGYGGGFMPCLDPLPLAPPCAAPPLTIPDDVPIYNARPDLPYGQDTQVPAKLPVKEKPPKEKSVTGDKACKDKGTAAQVKTQPKTTDARGAKAAVKATPATPKAASSKTAAVKAAPKAGAPTAKATPAASGNTRVKQNTAKPNTPPKAAAAAKMPTAQAKAAGGKPAAKTTSQPAAVKTAVVKTPVSNTQKSAPATKAVQAPKANVAKAPYSTPVKQTAQKYVPAAKSVSAPKTSVAKAPAKSAPKAVSRPAAAKSAPARGGGHK